MTGATAWEVITARTQRRCEGHKLYGHGTFHHRVFNSGCLRDVGERCYSGAVRSGRKMLSFEQRHDPDAKRPEVQTVPIGWRGLIEEPGQSRSNFSEIFLKGVEESGQ